MEAAPPVRWAGRSREHWLLLLLAAGVVAGLAVLGLALEPDERGVGTHEQLGLRPCLPMQVWSLPCPGCGVTTSVTLATQGRFLAALWNQPFGFAVWLLLLAFVAWAALGHLRGRDLWERLQAWRSGPWLWAGGVLAVVGWLYKIWLVRA
ncbi:MAG: DUF2752 domain-containing protein [Myxococcaceae bacterium]|nr:DUF2752 domain-containing protein [Myxococcaceae bacterium]